MAKTKLNPCGCDMFIPFGFKTHFLGIQISASVMCICCRKKVRARTLEKAIEKWNKKMGKGGYQPIAGQSSPTPLPQFITKIHKILANSY